jgi:multimeric flavodoxin WrbA
MKTLLVVYHSMTGGSEQMARALIEGAATEAGTETRLLHASAAGAADVLDADGYVFATPEHLGAISGLMKDFFDRCYYPALERINGRPYAALICAGSDGQNAARQIERIATGWRLRPVAKPLIVSTHAQAVEAILAPKRIGSVELDRCRELGAILATGLAAGIF